MINRITGVHCSPGGCSLLNSTHTHTAWLWLSLQPSIKPLNSASVCAIEKFYHEANIKTPTHIIDLAMNGNITQYYSYSKHIWKIKIRKKHTYYDSYHDLWMMYVDNPFENSLMFSYSVLVELSKCERHIWIATAAKWRLPKIDFCPRWRMVTTVTVGGEAWERQDRQANRARECTKDTNKSKIEAQHNVSPLPTLSVWMCALFILAF